MLMKGYWRGSPGAWLDLPMTYGALSDEQISLITTEDSYSFDEHVFFSFEKINERIEEEYAF